jgi:CheY-like chemotaxis protein
MQLKRLSSIVGICELGENGSAKLPSKRILILEKENARLIAAAAAESLRVESFLREISHDLRNSLSTVLTGSEVLLAMNNSPELVPILLSIQRQANVITQIADRVAACYDPQGPLPASPPASPLATINSEELGDTPVDQGQIRIDRKPLRILAIDDRRDVLLPLRVLLTKEGHEIAIAADGVSGLSQMLTFKPEMVLCDINLPGKLSGLDVARNIRLQTSGDAIYIVALSGDAQAADLEDSAKAGFDFHIAKPITVTALRNLIENRPKFKVDT